MPSEMHHGPGGPSGPDTVPPRAIPEPPPRHRPPGSPDPDDVPAWRRGLVMVLFAILFNVAQTVLLLAAVIQFFWLLVRKERNTALAEFGEGLGRWLDAVARFQTGATDERPFPWTRWPG
jgi:hypothetical protein